MAYRNSDHLMRAFLYALRRDWSTLPTGHGALVHTNRLGQRWSAREHLAWDVATITFTHEED